MSHTLGRRSRGDSEWIDSTEGQDPVRRHEDDHVSRKRSKRDVFHGLEHEESMQLVSHRYPYRGDLSRDDADESDPALPSRLRSRSHEHGEEHRSDGDPHVNVNVNVNVNRNRNRNRKRETNRMEEHDKEAQERIDSYRYGCEPHSSLVLSEIDPRRVGEVEIREAFRVEVGFEPNNVFIRPEEFDFRVTHVPAVVDFSTIGDAKRVLETTKYRLYVRDNRGRERRVGLEFFQQGDRSFDIPPRTVAVRRLSDSVTDLTVWNEMEKWGRVEYVSVPRTRDGYSRGYAVVEYSTPYNAARAVARGRDMDIDGRVVSISFYDEENPNHSFRDGDGLSEDDPDQVDWMHMREKEYVAWSMVHNREHHEAQLLQKVAEEGRKMLDVSDREKEEFMDRYREYYREYWKTTILPAQEEEKKKHRRPEELEEDEYVEWSMTSFRAQRRNQLELQKRTECVARGIPFAPLTAEEENAQDDFFRSYYHQYFRDTILPLREQKAAQQREAEENARLREDSRACEPVAKNLQLAVYGIPSSLQSSSATAATPSSTSTEDTHKSQPIVAFSSSDLWGTSSNAPSSVDYSSSLPGDRLVISNQLISFVCLCSFHALQSSLANCLHISVFHLLGIAFWLTYSENRSIVEH